MFNVFAYYFDLSTAGINMSGTYTHTHTIIDVNKNEKEKIEKHSVQSPSTSTVRA